MSDLVFLPAHQLAKGIQNRQFSATEVLEAHLKHIAKHNPKINAFITLDEEGARKKASLADEALAKGEIWGLLHGVPFTVKDCYETAGIRTTCGYKGFSNYIPKEDATIIARLKNAGGILMGKTNLAIFANDAQTNSDFGRTNNPWNLEYTVGGSSGGSAASVAAGFSPLDLCSGLGGSGRIPAHFCGVFGIKPTEQRVSMAGGWLAPLEGDKGLQYMYAPGVMTRSVEDLKLWLGIVEGADGKFWQVPPAISEPLDERSLKEYRIAWTDNFGIPVTPETRATLEKLVSALESAGCRVEKASPLNFDYVAAVETYGELTGAWLSNRPIPKLPTLKNDLRKLFSGASVVRGALRGTRMNLKQYAAAMAKRDYFTSQVQNFLGQWDAWLVPTTAIAAFPHQPVGQAFEIQGQKVPYLDACVTFTGLFTLTGNPVVVLPVGKTEQGLPIGLQLVGRRWHDMRLLNLSEKIMEVTAGFQRPPGY
jgi:amidase